MATEIERKFLVVSDAWRAAATPLAGVRMRQGYLASGRGRTVRVRMVDSGSGGSGSSGESAAYLTIKGPADPSGVTRAEFEYAIPARDAEYMLDHLCQGPLIEKTRHHVPFEGVTFEVDVFAGDNAGLIVAEVELRSADQPVPRPAWLGAEVTTDPRYRNSSLVERPFSTWTH